MPAQQQPHIDLYMHAGQRGAAEKVRFFLKEAGLTFSDIEVDADTFKAMCDDHSLHFSTLPAIKYGGDDSESKLIEGPTAILASLAKLADNLGTGQANNLYMGEPENADFVLSICEAATRCETDMASAAEDDRKAVHEKYFTLFTEVLNANDDGDARSEEWAIGTMFTYGDVAMFAAVNYACSLQGAGMTLRAFPKLKEFHDKIAQSKRRIEIYLSQRQGQPTPSV